MIDDVARQVMRHLGGSPSRPAPLTSVLYTNRGERHSSVLAFLLSASGDPAAVVKLSRDSCHIRREFDALQLLAKRFDRSSPTPYLTGETRGVAFLAMEAVRGAVVAESEFTSIAGLALREIIACHRVVQSGTMVETQIAAELLEPIRMFEHVCLPSRPSLAKLCESVRTRVEALRGVDLPYIPQHGDLSLDNILRRPDGTLVIIDWEEFGVVGLPAYDLVTLFTTLSANPLDRNRPRRRFLDSLRRYAHALNIDSRWRPLLLPLGMMRFALFCATEGRPEPLERISSNLDTLATMSEDDWWL